MEGLVITDRRDAERDHTRVLARTTYVHTASHTSMLHTRTHIQGVLKFLLSKSIFPHSLISYLLCDYTVVGGQYPCQPGDIIL